MSYNYSNIFHKIAGNTYVRLNQICYMLISYGGVYVYMTNNKRPIILDTKQTLSEIKKSIPYPADRQFVMLAVDSIMRTTDKRTNDIESIESTDVLVNAGCVDALRSLFKGSYLEMRCGSTVLVRKEPVELYDYLKKESSIN